MFMKRIKNQYLFCILIFSCLYFLSTCSDDPDLSLERKNYTGEELRIDGYYYYINLDDSYIECRFLYRNGIYLRYACRTIDLDVVDNTILNNVNSLGKEKISWGIFYIVDDNITCKNWISPHEGRLGTAVSEGYILNDTTFKIVKESYSGNAYPPDLREKLWHFRQFAHKPDSTNNFIN
jgi:hypothetical protein